MTLLRLQHVIACGSAVPWSFGDRRGMACKEACLALCTPWDLELMKTAPVVSTLPHPQGPACSGPKRLGSDHAPCWRRDSHSLLMLSTLAGLCSTPMYDPQLLTRCSMRAWYCCCVMPRRAARWAIPRCCCCRPTYQRAPGSMESGSSWRMRARHGRVLWRSTPPNALQEIVPT